MTSTRKTEPGRGNVSSPKPVTRIPTETETAQPDASKFAVPSDFGGKFEPAVNLTELKRAMTDPLTSKYDLQLGRETTIVYVGKKVRQVKT